MTKIENFYHIIIFVIIFALILLMQAYFHRLPDYNWEQQFLYLKNIDKDNALILAPSFGRIIKIDQNDKNQSITIRLTLFDIHAQYIPCDGIIVDKKYTQGHYYFYGNRENESEKNEIIIRMKNGEEIKVTQYAGYFTRRIIDKTKIGDKVKRGEYYGFITYGSRVKIELPLGVKIMVKKNEEMKGFKTIIAKKMEKK